jgi:hypothetical protein
MLSSTTQRATGTQLTFGPESVATDHVCLFVVARLPSSRPASAASMAPLQTVTRYLSFGYIVLMNSTVAFCG